MLLSLVGCGTSLRNKKVDFHANKCCRLREVDRRKRLTTPVHGTLLFRFRRDAPFAGAYNNTDARHLLYVPYARFDEMQAQTVHSRNLSL